MNDPRLTYEARLRELNLKSGQLKGRLGRTSLLRLAAFLAASYLSYMAFEGSYWYSLGALLVAGFFVFLVARHQDLKYEFQRLGELIRLNQTELEVLKGNFTHLPDGAAYRDADHAFAEDLDLFGPGSFFQYLNRTGLSSGTNTLANWLCSNDVSGIPAKQEAVRELSDQLEWRQAFTATARLISTPLSARELTDWMQNYMPIIPSWTRYLPLGFSLLSLVVGFLVAFGLLPLEMLIGLFFTGLLITLPFSKDIGRLALATGKTQETFRQYRRLVEQVEGHAFQSDRLRTLKEKLGGAEMPVSKILNQFNHLIGALDQRNNLLVAVFANAFFLWDIRQAYAVERWISTYGDRSREWFEALSAFDAGISLANFSYNHPGYAFPEITDKEEVTLQVRQLAHPLLRENAVCNDIRVQRE